MDQRTTLNHVRRKPETPGSFSPAQWWRDDGLGLFVVAGPEYLLSFISAHPAVSTETSRPSSHVTSCYDQARTYRASKGWIGRLTILAAAWFLVLFDT